MLKFHAAILISIHALREEGDRKVDSHIEVYRQFLSTPSARRATDVCAIIERGILFLSTPSARRATFSPFSPSKYTLDFYPRPPRGGRPEPGRHPPVRKEFLSTPSARRATTRSKQKRGFCSISIHALREEGDPDRRTCASVPDHFYPRPPRGGRPCPALAGSGQVRYFYPRPPRGGRLTYARMGSALMLFLSTPSARRAT